MKLLLTRIMLLGRLSEFSKLALESLVLAFVTVIVGFLIFLVFVFLPFSSGLSDLARFGLGSLVIGIGAGLLAVSRDKSSIIGYALLLALASKVLEIFITTSIEALIPVVVVSQKANNFTYFQRLGHLAYLNFLPEQASKNVIFIILAMLIACFVAIGSKGSASSS